MSEKFDFSKIEEQKKFDELPVEKNNEIVGEAQEELKEIHKPVENKETENYDETEKIAEWESELAKRDFNTGLLRNIPSHFHAEIARRLIEDGRSYAVGDHLSDFQGLDHKNIVIEMLKNGGVRVVNRNIDKFKNLDNEVAIELIRAGDCGPHTVLTNLDRFRDLDSKEIFEKLIKIGDASYVVRNAARFGIDRDKNLAMKLIDLGKWLAVAENLNNFRGIERADHKEIALKFIRNQQMEVLSNWLNNFYGLDKSIAIKLIEAGRASRVVNYLGRFGDLDKDVALKLIDNGYEEIVFERVGYFSGFKLNRDLAVDLLKRKIGTWYILKYSEKFEDLKLDKEIALLLLNNGKSYDLIDNIEKFNINRGEFALMFINKGYDVKILMRNIHKFRDGSLGNEVAQKMIEGHVEIKNLVKKLSKFKGLENNIALELVKADEAEAVMEYKNRFSDFNVEEFIAALLETGQEKMISRYCYKYQDTPLNNAIAHKIIDAGHEKILSQNLEYFTNLDREIALELIEANESQSVIVHYQKFINLDREVAFKLINAAHGGFVVRISEIFQDFVLDQNVMLAIIEAGDSDALGALRHNLKKFQGQFDESTIYKIIEKKHGDLLIIDPEKFGIKLNNNLAVRLIETDQGTLVAMNLEKFQDVDDYETIALTLIEAGNGREVIDNLEKFKNIDFNKIALKFIETGNGILLSRWISRFTTLNEEVALKLIKSGEEECVLKYLNKFSGIAVDKVNEITNKFPFIREGEAILMVIEEKVLENIARDEFENIYNLLKSSHPNWEDQENIIKPFETGADIFGYQKMFEYLGRPKLTRHDGLHNFLKIIKAFEASGLKAPAFYSNILDQVRRDDAQYYAGTAHHHLNSLVDNIDYDFEGVAEKAEIYKDIEKLQKLIAEMGDTKNIFSSWKNLKKYEEVCNLLGRSEILDKLKGLKKEGKEQLYKYIETLAFHPNISMEKVFEFWERPERFLKIGDTHTPDEVQNRKKPSNYIEIPNLDLTAEELRDALVEGAYDRLQAFSPIEIVYQISKGEKISLREDLARQIGIRDKNLRKKLGISESEELKSDSKLFAKLNQLFKMQKLDLKKYLNGEMKLPEKLAQELDQFRTKSEGEEYRLKINKKSDPDGVVAGNDTACCMPFGSGKNNVYTFNPICALFTVQKKNADGGYRTIAQSVLTLDKDINKNIAELVKKLNSIELKMHEVMDETVLLNKPSVITCDNVELAENYKDHPNAGYILEEIYRDFFQEYVKKYSAPQNLDTDKVVIGLGYSDSLVHLSTINNTFAPEAPVGYSDNLHGKTYLLDLDSDKELKFISDKKIIFAAEANIKPEADNLPKGVGYLTYRDSLPVAYIEGKAYQKNDSLIQYLHNMENALIAKDVNNEAKNRPNMSFKYQGTDGKIHGYLLAYEGKINDKEEHDGEEVVYITDLATDDNKRAGGSLIKAFAEEYKRNYLDKENPVSIYMQLREGTSYPIIKKQFDRLLKDAGYKFNFEEIGAYKAGEDMMHEVIIRAEKI